MSGVTRNGHSRQGERRRNTVRNDFTVIELLIVAAITAILAAMLPPVLNRARDLALQSTCENNLKQIGTADAQYVNDYAGWMYGPKLDVPDGSGDSAYWAPSMARLGYLPEWSRGKSHVAVCPAVYPFEAHAKERTYAKRGYRLANQRNQNCYWKNSGDRFLVSTEETAVVDQKADLGVSRFATTWDSFQNYYQLCNAAYTNFSMSHSEKGNILFYDGHTESGCMDYGIFYSGINPKSGQHVKLGQSYR